MRSGPTFRLSPGERSGFRTSPRYDLGVPFFLPPLLAALVLVALTFVASYPVRLSSFRVDVLGLVLMLLAFFSLRFAFRQAGAGARASGVRVAPWFWPAALVVAALMIFRTVHALNI